MKTNKPWFFAFVNFSGWLILLLGIFFSLKFTFNLIYYKEYPISGLFFSYSFPRTTQDCFSQYNYPLYDEKGLVRKPNEYEEKLRKDNINNCLKQIQNNRQESKIRDFWTAFGFVFVGGGILLTKKLYTK